MTSRSVVEITQECIRQTEGLRVHYDPLAQETRDGKFQSLSQSSLAPAVVEYMSSRFPNGLFTHQHDAIENVLTGMNTVVATRTSSGKSLIYSLPVMHSLCADPESTAMLLFPQKALANDQLLKLQEMAANIPCVNQMIQKAPYMISRYDGSTESGLRPEIREQVQVMLTNPDMLHLAIMQYHENHWARFFRNLKLVAIDECHEYRGVFGTNVSHLLHRLRQICRRYNANPRFVATSATVSDPQGHMEQLTGEPFNCVAADRDGSLQGRRKFWMVSGKDHYFDTGRKLALKLADQGLSVLAFCPSRTAAERMIARMRRKDESESHIRVYRAGLSPNERAEIESGLRDRSVRVVFSTSALELGIDIGEIDAVVCIGLPHSMMSLWQRAGRAARGGREGATVFVPADTPIDTYYRNHPNELFARDHEPLVLNRKNQRLLCQHYACAVHEVGGDDDNLDFTTLGSEFEQIHKMRAEGLDRAEFYQADPHVEVSIRGSGEGSYALMVGDEKIGEIDSFHLLRESFKNAIYRHGGRSFRVKDVIRGKKIVRLSKEFTFNETTPFIQKRIKLRQMLDTADYQGLRLATVRIDATEFLSNVTERDPSGAVVRQWPGSQGLAPHQLPTEGTMLVLRDDFWEKVAAQMTGKAQAALESCERLMCGLFPTISGPCDTQDFSSGTDVLATGEKAIFLYDQVYDGVGLTFVAFEQMSQLISKSFERLQSCDCSEDKGCIRCIANQQKEQAASKHDTAILLQAILHVLQAGNAKVVRSEADWSQGLLNTANLTCSQCSEKMSSGVRFCSNCGFKVGV